MRIAVRYYTRSGNTERLAHAVAGAVGVPAQSISVPLAEPVDVLLLGCSYYAFDVDEAVKTFVADNKEKIGKIVCFGTSAMMKSMQKPMRKVADAAGVALAAEEFHCRGAFWKFHPGHPDAADLAAAAQFARQVTK